MRVLAYVVMPNHWHLIVWPDSDLQLSTFMHWLTMTHSQRWHTKHRTTGTGPVYQGRYKAIPVQSDHHLLTVIRYVERNPVRAGLIMRAQDWHWSSARERGKNSERVLLDAPPLPLPDHWLEIVNEGQDQSELIIVREAVKLNTPVGDDGWRQLTATAFDLKRTFRPPGRPRRN